MEKILNSKTLFEMLENSVEKYSSRILQSYREQNGIKNITYKEFFEKVKKVSSAFRKLGIKKGTKVLLISDNRYEWLIADMALLSIGAVDVPRSSSSPESELGFIAKHSDSEFAIIEDEKLYQSIKGIIKSEKIIVFNRSENFINFSDLFKDDGKEYEKANIDKDDLVTIIYTSGTTGNPKGVMLTHKNFMHNVSAITPLIKFKTYGKEGDVTVSVLPVWHIFERTFEYVCIAGGAKIYYSNVKNFARDLIEIKPTIMSAVPRIWEHIYRKIIDRMKNEKVFKKTFFYIFLN
ncbi:MAG: AMP-binding protein, partial [candidate division WOR-3 bacterium]